jgi:hypothetical protein
MAHRVLRRHRIVFPVRQDVDGEVVHRGGHLRIAQPVLPHVGVAHRHRGGDRHAHLAHVAGQHRRRQLAAQQHLVAHDHPAQGPRVRPRVGDALRDLARVGPRVAIEPDPHQHLHAVALRDRRHRRQALALRIGAHAIEALRQRVQIGINARGTDEGVRVERRLPRQPVRRVGHAGDARRRRIRQLHRTARQPPPQQARTGRQQQQQPGEAAGAGWGRGRWRHAVPLAHGGQSA